jgi:ABC-2 type transport system ATP-binding protein
LTAIEDIGYLKARALRTIEFHFAQPVSAEVFSGLQSVQEVQAHGDALRLKVTGPLDAVVKAAARFEVVDLASHQPTLEDVFLAFYGRSETDAP